MEDKETKKYLCKGKSTIEKPIFTTTSEARNCNHLYLDYNCVLGGKCSVLEEYAQTQPSRTPDVFDSRKNAQGMSERLRKRPYWVLESMSASAATIQAGAEPHIACIGDD